MSLVANYANFCRNTALSARDQTSVLKMVIANLKSADRRRAYADTFPGNPYMHWDYVEAMTTNSFGDLAACLALVSFLEFPDIEGHYKLEPARDGLVCLSQFASDVASCGILVSLQQVLHMLVLANTLGLAGHHILEQYTARALERPTRDMVSELTARMADYRFSVEQYTRTFAWVVRHCRVHADFEHEFATHVAQREGVAAAMRLKHLEISVGRPRLMDKLSRRRELLSVSTGRGDSAVVGEGRDTFQVRVSILLLCCNCRCHKVTARRHRVTVRRRRSGSRACASRTRSATA